MKYLALIMLISSIFAGSANAHVYMMDEHPDAFVPLYSPVAGNVMVAGPHAPMGILPARPVERIFLMHR